MPVLSSALAPWVLSGLLASAPILPSAASVPERNALSGPASRRERAVPGSLAVATAQRRLFETASFPRAEDVSLVCRIVNEARTERDVRVEALDAEGVATSDSGAFRLQPDASYLAGGGPTALRCRFTVLGDAAGLRAHGLVVSERGEPISLVPAPLSPVDGSDLGVGDVARATARNPTAGRRP